jgi:tetratricopeptide (TPR) repeat protein
VRLAAILASCTALGVVSPVAAVAGAASGHRGLATEMGRQSPALEPAVAEHIRSLETAAESLVREGASNERRAEAEGLLGRVHHAYSLTASAEPRYRTAQRLAPADFRWPYLLAYLLQQESRADEALTSYERARSLRPDYAPLYVHVGNLHLAQNLVDEAAAAFGAALAIDASLAAAHYGLGQVAMARREYAVAVEQFSKVLADVPAATRVHYVLALAYRGLGRLDEAQMHLARQGPVGVRVADPLVDGLQELVRGARLSIVRGRAAFDAGRYVEAADAFRQAATAEPESVPAHVNLGTTLAQLKQVTGAIDEFRRALELDPRNRAALFNLGVLYGESQRHAEAVTYLARLVDLEPGDHTARVVLGRALYRSGRAEEALAAFETVRRASPDDEDALLGQVEVLTALGRHTEALGELEQAHGRLPRRARTTVQLAYLLAVSPQEDLRNPGRALPLARGAYEASGAIGHGAIVAMALAGLGRCDEAVVWQRDLIAKAERQAPALVDALRADLDRYRTSCR